MSPNAYAAAKRLATDPGATPAERENARARCREHEEAQRRAAPPRPLPRRGARTRAPGPSTAGASPGT